MKEVPPAGDQASTPDQGFSVLRRLSTLAAPAWLAGAAILLFGLVGVTLSVVSSRRLGTMAHCAVYCPIGLVANLVGKVSPFRMRIAEGCTKCGSCSKACRYDALRSEDIDRRRPGLSCTLCGDCIGSCREGQMEYRFLGLRGESARAPFIALVAGLHAAFLGVAMM